jgi:hypothetical protein
MAMALVSSAQTAEITAGDGTHCRVSFYSSNIVRVTKWAATAAEPQTKSLVVTMQPQASLKVDKKTAGKNITMSAGKLSVVIDGRTENIRIAHAG